MSILAQVCSAMMSGGCRMMTMYDVWMLTYRAVMFTYSQHFSHTDPVGNYYSGTSIIRTRRASEKSPDNQGSG